MKVSLIAAMVRGFAIGKDGALPWHLPRLWVDADRDRVKGDIG